MTPDDLGLFWLIAVAGLCIFYGLPSFIAFRRGHPNRWAILALNVCLGGSGIGWAAALIWALYAVHRTDNGRSHGGESGLNVFANDTRPVRLVTGGSAPNGGARGATMTTAAAVAEIERLSALRAAGHLSEAEFIRLKSTVLERL